MVSPRGQSRGWFLGFGLARQQAIAALIAKMIITRSMMTLMPVSPLAQEPQTALRGGRPVLWSGARRDRPAASGAARPDLGHQQLGAVGDLREVAGRREDHLTVGDGAVRHRGR